MNDRPYVVAVVLNWNNYSDTRETLASLATIDYDGLDVVLVDNGSDDDSAERLQTVFPETTVVQLNDNKGFPGGNNHGIGRALEMGADYIWLLNNDVLFPNPSILNHLVDRLAKSPDLGLISPQINHYPQTQEVWFKQGYIDERSGLSGHEANRRWFLPLGASGPPERNGELLENDYVPLCCALIPATVFSEVGTLDERYFLYGSDVEFALRLRDARFDLATDPTLKCHHKVSASSKSTSGPIVSYYSTRNQWLLRRDHIVGHSLLFPLLFGWWFVVQVGLSFMRREFESVRALIVGCIDGIRGRSGRGPYP